MKKIIFLILPVLLFVSCEKDDFLPGVENITKGQKWTLEIGSSPNDVYGQLQSLGLDKNFDQVAIVYRQPFSRPEEIKSDIGLYRAITLETTFGRTERVLIEFDQDKVSSIETGGGLLDPVTKWPENVSDESAIHVNDPLDDIREKLLSVYKNPTYNDYQIVLSDKWLAKPYDPDMSNYDEWAFAFSENINATRERRSSARLYFKNGALVKIRNEYDENEVVY